MRGQVNITSRMVQQGGGNMQGQDKQRSIPDNMDRRGTSRDWSRIGTPDGVLPLPPPCPLGALTPLLLGALPVHSLPLHLAYSLAFPLGPFSPLSWSSPPFDALPPSQIVPLSSFFGLFILNHACMSNYWFIMFIYHKLCLIFPALVIATHLAFLHILSSFQPQICLNPNPYTPPPVPLLSPYHSLYSRCER